MLLFSSRSICLLAKVYPTSGVTGFFAAAAHSALSRKQCCLIRRKGTRYHLTLIRGFGFTPTRAHKMAAQVVPLPEVERLSPACLRILGGNPGKFTLQGTNTYIVGTGASRLLIDTGEGRPSWIAALKRTLAAENISIKSVLLTHWHHDHIDGIGDLLQHSPETTVYKCDPSPGWLNITDGQVFAVQGATLTAVHTPGHTTDHMAFVLREEDALFTGDNVLGHGTAVFEDLALYMRSLAKMEKLAVGRAYPGHGPVLPDAPAKISEYISHRHEREQQVLQTLGLVKKTTGKRGTWTPMGLVKVIYQAYPESLHGPAAAGVAQILQKLKGEDKVQEVGGVEGAWQVKEPLESKV